MRAPRCTIDSSSVIALDHLDLLPQLNWLFSRALVPKAVREDVFKRRSTKDRLRGMFASYAFLERCDDYDRGAVDLLLVERTRRGMQDRDEVEAVVQAAQQGAVVVVDDPWGRELAARDDLEYHGTFWVLKRFYELGLLSATSIRNCLAALSQRGTRLPWEMVSAFLVDIGQEPL